MSNKLVVVNEENHGLLKRIAEKIEGDLSVQNITISSVLNETLSELFNSGKYDNFFHLLKRKIAKSKKKKFLERMFRRDDVKRIFQEGR
jgi:hypothetical protein